MANEEPILNAEIDIRSFFSPFDYPSLPEVIQAVAAQLPDDRLRVVKQMRGTLQGIYKIISTDYSLYADKTLTVREVVMPVVLRRKQPRVETERTGTLVTIYDAFDGPAQSIPSSRFNEYFNGIPGVTLVRPTTPQFHKGTRVLNGNRYVVLDFNVDTVDVGEYVNIDKFQFKLNFYGQQRYCYLCLARHGRLCPEKEKFKELAAARADRISHKFYSDSTLRKANQLGMTADVACTSGAGIGQVANMIAVDPSKIPDVIIVAGANELRHTDSEKQFQYEVNQAADKVFELTRAKTKVTLVLPTTPRSTLADEIKYAVMKETFSAVQSLTVIDVPPNTVPYDGIHPTKEGTLALLDYVQKHPSMEVNLCLDADYMATDRNYSQVSSYFRYGCRACDSTAYTATLCAQCVIASDSVDTTRLYQLAADIYKQHNPALGEDVQMADIVKRGIASLTAAPTPELEEDITGGAGSKKARVDDA